MRIRNRLLSPLCVVGLSLGLLPRQSPAVDQDSALERALGSQQPLYKFSPAAVEAAVKLCASRDPGHAGVYVVMILHSGRTDAAAIAPSLVKAAIQGLGADPRPGLVADIVHASVTTAPSEVLPIVAAAVTSSPRSAGPGIVSAAIKAVPHPEQIVSVKLPPVTERANGDGKQFDDKQLAAPTEKLLTLAEAIVQTALAADPGLSENALSAAVDQGLISVLAPNRPAVLTTVLTSVLPVPIVSTGGGGGGGISTLAAPGPVSP